MYLDFLINEAFGIQIAFDFCNELGPHIFEHIYQIGYHAESDDTNNGPADVVPEKIVSNDVCIHHYEVSNA